MNWERAKNIFIVFFVVVDLCLFALLCQITAGSSKVSETAVQQTIKLLQQHNISVSEENIPRKKLKNCNYHLTTLSLKENKTAEKWLGKGFRLTEENAEAHRYLYQNKNKQLLMDKTNIAFSVNKNAVLLPEKETKEMENHLSAKLKKMGFSEKKYYFSSVRYENGLYCAEISPLLEETRVVGIRLVVAADKEEMVQISGNWFQCSSKESFSDDGLLDVTAVLADFIYQEEHQATEITKISLAAYVAEEYLENKAITAVPIYVFQIQDGTEYYFDARTGEQMKREMKSAS